MGSFSSADCTDSRVGCATARIARNFPPMSLSAEEVAKHASKTDCWVVVGEEVLDVTEFMEDHPGGSKAIMMFAGRDATEEFDMLHERKVIKKYGIDEGTVVVKGTFK
ncbi:unnamed protein product, partial [Polarella glacialis]